MANTRWKARLAASLEALRPAYDSGTENYKTTIAQATMKQLRATIPFGKTNGARGLGGAVTDTALRLFLAFVSPSGVAARELGQQLGAALEAHPDLLERLTDNLITLADNLNIRPE